MRMGAAMTSGSWAIDVLGLSDRGWVVVESKNTALSVWVALPQVLASLSANPQGDRSGFALITNGDDLVFIKVETGQYALSRVFSPLVLGRELGEVLQILRRLGTLGTAPATPASA
jgi:hypothetical protein